MKVVDEIKERIGKSDKPGKRYSPFVTLYNKDTGASKQFPAIDAADATSRPNSKWSKEPIAAPAPIVVAKPLIEAIAPKAPETIADPAEALPLPAVAEQPEERPVKRGRKPAEY